MKRTILTGVLVLAAVVPAMAEMKVKSKAESEAVQAMIAAEPQGADAVIAAVEALLSKFADTQFKEVALLAEATAYQQKKDYASAELTNERVLEIDPMNPQAAMQLGEVITAHVGDNDLDKEERLTKAEKSLNRAVANIDNKPSEGMTDEVWAANKKFTLAQAENDLGLVAMLRKNYPAAAAAFKLAVDNDPQPAYQVRLALSDQKSGKNDDALALCDKLLADPQLHPAIKRIAVSVKAAATAAKAAPAAQEPVPCARSWARSNRASTTGSLIRRCSPARSPTVRPPTRPMPPPARRCAITSRSNSWAIRSSAF